MEERGRDIIFARMLFCYRAFFYIDFVLFFYSQARLRTFQIIRELV